MSLSRKPTDVAAADSCFFCPFRIEESVGNVITKKGDSSPKEVEDEHAGESAMSSARRTLSPPFTAGRDSPPYV